MPSNRHIIERALPERTKLLFYFPTPSEGEDYHVISLPFFENIQIKESKKARYQKYSMIARSSNLYSYQGADSRQLSLSFNISLPHILEEHPDINLDKYVKYISSSENTEFEKEKFKNPLSSNKIPKSMAFTLGTKYTRELASESARMVLDELALSGFTGVGESAIKSRYSILDFKGISSIQILGLSTFLIANNLNQSDSTLLRYRIIDLIIYWTNIIRASVVNYSKNPIYGPPIIRLRHGIMYQDIPCICTDYSISYNEAAGYDIDTLLPRQLKITMKLEEMRSGDFGEFTPSDPIKKDNLAGWEAVVLGDTHSMDPGYGDIL